MKARAMCAVMQGDPPFRFTWTQDGKRIESDLPVLETGAVFRTSHFRDYSMITVESLTLAHAGNVTCSVENDASSTSQSATLKVNGKFFVLFFFSLFLSKNHHKSRVCVCVPKICLA